MTFQITPRIWRRIGIVFTYALLAVLSNVLAFSLRFEGSIPPAVVGAMIETLPLLIAIRLLTFVPFHLYEGLWRYTSLWDIRNLVLGVLSSTLLLIPILISRGLLTHAYPQSVLLTDSLILAALIGGVRLSRRIFWEHERAVPGKRVLIIGAGDAADLIIRDIKNNPYYNVLPVGIIDDDPLKKATTIHGVKVLGTRRELPRFIDLLKPDEVMVAIPSAEPAQLRAIVQSLEPYKVPIKMLPNLRDVLEGKVALNQVRNLSMEDLLARQKLNLDDTAVRQYVQGKKVLVTGAGGSIGSELCRQLLQYRPEKLIILDQYENNLFHLLNELGALSAVPVEGVIASVSDRLRMEEVFTAHRPAIVFHAAAHKHVPLMEGSPFEAIKNNVFGTWYTLTEAIKAKAESVVLISTDKAVCPSNFMGATKALAELLVRALSEGCATRLMAVRFGNVLGSEGSAIPLFMKQIQKGGPVTITHPEMKRFFMLIPEAVQLVLQAASLGRGGELFVLEMGEQIPIVEMARNLIRLSGYVPDKEIKLEFVGLRPGEKLTEELFDSERETVQTTSNRHIMKLIGNEAVNKAELLQWMGEMGSLLVSPNRSVPEAAEKIQQILPQFQVEVKVARQVLERKYQL